MSIEDSIEKFIEEQADLVETCDRLILANIKKFHDDNCLDRHPACIHTFSLITVRTIRATVSERIKKSKFIERNESGRNESGRLN